MPELSRFLGVVVAMYYRDHLAPHFHAIYGEFRASVDIATGLIDGWLPRRTLALIDEWRILHQEELLAAWKSTQEGRPPSRIEPLE